MFNVIFRETKIKPLRDNNQPLFIKKKKTEHGDVCLESSYLRYRGRKIMNLKPAQENLARLYHKNKIKTKGLGT
jgi:hypothetical protein